MAQPTWLEMHTVTRPLREPVGAGIITASTTPPFLLPAPPPSVQSRASTEEGNDVTDQSTLLFAVLRRCERQRIK
jgi:hypothetical protein